MKARKPAILISLPSENLQDVDFAAPIATAKTMLSILESRSRETIRAIILFGFLACASAVGESYGGAIAAVVGFTCAYVAVCEFRSQHYVSQDIETVTNLVKVLEGIEEGKKKRQQENI